MNIKGFRNILAASAIAAFSLTSCVGDLDVENINPQKRESNSLDGLFTKMYANMVLTSQKGPDAGDNSELLDILDIDEGTSSMIRQIWNANELTTDEAECIWGDAGIPEFNHNSWSDAHPMMRALYYRLNFGVTLANDYLDMATDKDAATLTKRAEARFMRALYYYYLMDIYGNVPFKTTMKGDAVQTPRAELYKFLVGELKDISEGSGSEQLAEPKTNTYGRADKAAAWLLLARLYLNAKVYTGEADWTNAKNYADKTLKSGYELVTDSAYGYSPFQLLFMGDNDTNGAQKEIILPALHDGELTQTWGGCLFIIASTTEDDLTKVYPTGTSEKWGGNRARLQFAQKFFPNDDAPAGTPVDVSKAANDARALFFTQDHKASIEDESTFKNGYAYVKFLNTHADGSKTHHTQFVDTDFPMLRLAEAYLTYAEADAQLNGGNCTPDGLQKIKDLRKRSIKNDNITSFSLDDICDEWSREFGYEGRRRTDLIRFNKFGGQTDYQWQWMAGMETNGYFDAHYNIFALPASAVTADGLKQNPGY